MPARIRWNWHLGKLPAGAVYVGRPSRWGNPYRLAEYSRSEALSLYTSLLQEHPALVDRIRSELAGRDLACACPLDEPCHGDILLRVAAGGRP